MGLVPILWTSTPDGGKFDSNDWRVAGGLINGTQSFNIFQDIMRNATTFDTGFITLQHDLFEITVDLAVGYTLDAALSHTPKFALHPIGECLGYPEGNLYRETTSNTSFPYANLTAGGVDVDGDGDVDVKNLDRTKNAGSTTTVRFWTSVTVVGLTLLSQLLLLL
ncbi:hypothetical protein BDZ97DRAFT_502715 [Flammula alnicola]|nr:hypothetical protein BDZ97DRAFT_502715 [Flammula alnicola]